MKTTTTTSQAHEWLESSWLESSYEETSTMMGPGQLEETILALGTLNSENGTYKKLTMTGQPWPENEVGWKSPPTQPKVQTAWTVDVQLMAMQ